MDRKTLSQKTLADLRAIAKMQGVKSVAKYRKDELLDIIMAGGDVSVLTGGAGAAAPKPQPKQASFPVDDISDDDEAEPAPAAPAPAAPTPPPAYKPQQYDGGRRQNYGRNQDGYDRGRQQDQYQRRQQNGGYQPRQQNQRNDRWGTHQRDSQPRDYRQSQRDFQQPRDYQQRDYQQ
ncbi:MAG: Rho termination factor N-terminal domain-containing protein, partial [Clostridia bacterium]|nr:Rho termination factor N-terminal domain-containing protein [Clostridia bacterium]